MHDAFSTLREDLLRAGISPRRVNRYVRELSDHREDLIDYLESHGRSSQQAEDEADRRLGDRDVLLLPMLADNRFRSMAARWPALFYLALPLLSQLTLAIGFAVFLVLAASSPLRPAMIDLAAGAALLFLIASVIVSWLAMFAAYQRRATLRWPILAALAISTLAAATQINVTMPAAEIPGEITLALMHPAPLPLLTIAALSLLPLFLYLGPRSEA
ncbi:hypothetical protein [Devosia sp.]|uniref:hypothetical protein n=1 Tax=Devosia sp. TaxID=1871048 RepID=UPI001AC55D19|nr:hypothetical protein [Devosia sp.]MBN9335236.1 hypothetical protein [Devosia sp.]